MSVAFEFIRGLFVITLVAVGLVWFLWRWLRNSGDPALLLFRWGLTVPIVLGLIYAGIISRQNFMQGSRSAAMVVVYAALGGLVLAIIWVPVITGAVGGFVGSFFDGGTQEVEPKPYYSVFRSRQQKGMYFEALQEIRKQLDKFPTDFEGLMLLATLQAENLNDLPGAAVTVERLCAQTEHSSKNVAYALNRLADWHLDLNKDREAAREQFEKIIALMPETEMALRAAQRIGHLASNDMLLASQDRERMAVKKGVHNLGLQRGADGRLKAPEVDQEKLAEQYVTQLESHPQDTHAREQLAVIYAKHYQRLDLAADQLEQMIQQPGHAAKQVVGWLHLLADLQVICGADYETVAATLQRIIDLYPDLASAETALRRIDRLRLELKGKEKTSGVQLGVYEQNLGLKRKR